MSYFINPILGSLEEAAEKYANKYQTAEPFPSIAIEDFFNEEMLEEVLEEFPDLSTRDAIHFNKPKEIKFAGKGEKDFGPKTKAFMHFLNSEPFLHFLQKLTGIEEVIIGDPYFNGGGLHEIKRGGLLKIHADFNKHPILELDRRINALVYLNKDWKEEYGGHFQLWDKEMKHCVNKILPKFNTLAIFSTTSESYHGHPDPLTCPDDRSRKSLALYYYTNGRPESEVNGNHNTIFKERVGNAEDVQAFSSHLAPKKSPKNANSKLKEIAKNILPPFVVKGLKKLKS